MLVGILERDAFQHTAARRRLVLQGLDGKKLYLGFNTQPPEGGWNNEDGLFKMKLVSTHSRPKAAGRLTLNQYGVASRFNTQPPEGGWARSKNRLHPVFHLAFQHIAARRRLARIHETEIFVMFARVSTHSRPKAAGGVSFFIPFPILLFQHTAARRRLEQ